MYHRLLCTFQCFKCLADDMLSGLCQYLNGNIIRDQILFNECPKEMIFCLRCSREAYFDFFKTNLYQ